MALTFLGLAVDSNRNGNLWLLRLGFRLRSMRLNLVLKLFHAIGVLFLGLGHRTVPLCRVLLSILLGIKLDDQRCMSLP